MIHSPLVKLGSKPITKAEYLSLVAYSRKFTAEDIFFTEAGMDYPDLYNATIDLIDSGETAWGVPEFEDCLYRAIGFWVSEGLLLRTQMYAQWLAQSAEGYSRQWLEDFSTGNFWDYLDDCELRCGVLGKTEDYLYPLQFHHLVEAQRHREANRVWLTRRGANLAYQKFGFVDVENL